MCFTTENNNLSIALELYQLIWQRETKEMISIRQVDNQEKGLGLIGPGNGFLTTILEKIFGGFKTFQIHAILHDVFGRIYLKTGKGPGYLYVFRDSKLKGSSLCGHISGLIYCLIYGNNACKEIIKRYDK